MSNNIVNYETQLIISLIHIEKRIKDITEFISSLESLLDKNVPDELLNKINNESNINLKNSYKEELKNILKNNIKLDAQILKSGSQIKNILVNTKIKDKTKLDNNFKEISLEINSAVFNDAIDKAYKNIINVSSSR